MPYLRKCSKKRWISCSFDPKHKGMLHRLARNEGGVNHNGTLKIKWLARVAHSPNRPLGIR